MKSILLVEDDPFLIDIYSTKFREANFDVSVVSSGEEVLEKIEKKEPALLLLDIVLPDLDGWGVLKKIRDDKRFEDISIIILSNLGQRTDVRKGLDLGASKYLIKAHYTPAMVVEEVKKLLNENE